MRIAFLLALVAAVSGVGVFWYLRFKHLLRMESSLRRMRGHADDLKVFIVEILSGGAAAGFPRALNDVGHRTLAALHKLSPELQFWWIARQEGEAGLLVAHRGGAWAAQGAESFRFDSSVFREAVARGGASYDLRSGQDGGHPFLKSMAAHGVSRARLIPWGKTDGVLGILAVGDADAQGQGLSRLAPFLDIARPLATSMAACAADMARLHSTREQLQGGLTAAIEDLTVTQTRLTQKTREIKTLHDVATTLTSHTAQAQSTLSAIVSIVAKSLEADLVAFLLIDEDTGELVTQPGAYGLESDDLFYRIPLTEEQSSSVRVFKSGQAFLTGNAQNDPKVLSQFARLWKVHSLMVIPLKLEDKVIGVMRIGSYKPDNYAQEHLALMNVIAREAAVIVETAMLNRKLSQTAEQLTALNRMKDDFVSTVSHEFKTPLTTIMGFLTVILEGEAGILTEQQGKFLTIAMDASKRLSVLVADLLEISRLEGGVQMEMAPRVFEKIMRQSMDNHRHAAAAAKKTLNVAIPERLPRVVCDERWIGLALDNLISNALKFSRPGGRVDVSAADKGEFLMVTVVDQGIGIPAEDKDRIFEKFFRAGNRTEVVTPGTGLGLAIAKEVITKHGGKIWFESELGRGSKFHFIIKFAPRGETP